MFVNLFSSSILVHKTLYNTIKPQTFFFSLRCVVFSVFKKVASKFFLCFASSLLNTACIPHKLRKIFATALVFSIFFSNKNHSNSLYYNVFFFKFGYVALNVKSLKISRFISFRSLWSFLSFYLFWSDLSFW